MKVSLTLGLLATSPTSISSAKAVRAPSKRAQKNQEFLESWFNKNCKTSEGDGEDAVRPDRCNRKFYRYMNEWDKLQASFQKCGFFDEKVKNGGPRPAGRRRRRDEEGDEDEYDEDYEDYGEDDDVMFEIDWNGDESDGNYTTDTDEQATETNDYWVAFAQYRADYDDVIVTSDSTSDEDNSPIRTENDLLEVDERAFSKDPARAHRQIVNAMKQYTKRFLDDCSNSPQKLKRLTKVYRDTAKLHELILDTVAEKYRRLDERTYRQSQRV